MDRQKVKRKLDMIKFDMENRAIMASKQQKMQATANQNIIFSLHSSQGKGQDGN